MREYDHTLAESVALQGSDASSEGSQGVCGDGQAAAWGTMRPVAHASSAMSGRAYSGDNSDGDGAWSVHSAASVRLARWPQSVDRPVPVTGWGDLGAPHFRAPDDGQGL